MGAQRAARAAAATGARGAAGPDAFRRAPAPRAARMRRAGTGDRPSYFFAAGAFAVGFGAGSTDSASASVYTASTWSPFFTTLK